MYPPPSLTVHKRLRAYPLSRSALSAFSVISVLNPSFSFDLQLSTLNFRLPRTYPPFTTGVMQLFWNQLVAHSFRHHVIPAPPPRFAFPFALQPSPGVAYLGPSGPEPSRKHCFTALGCSLKRRRFDPAPKGRPGDLPPLTGHGTRLHGPRNTDHRSRGFSAGSASCW